MKNSAILIIACSTFISLFTTGIFIDTCSASDQITVGLDGPPTYDYSNIQDAIDAVTDNDSIYVSSGTYNQDITINKQITLTGSNKETTIINGVSSHVIKITANNVDLSGFTIQNPGGYDTKCIMMDHVEGCNIINNIIKYANDGIYLTVSNQNTISDNIIEYHDGNGIYAISSTDNTIYNNIIQKNNVNGIYFVSSNSNLFYKNDFKNNIAYNARDNGINFWNTSSQGNYWDDYNNPDSDNNKIGDTPYSIYGGSNKDYFPLGYFLNPQPTAHIISINPNPATEGQSVHFEGEGSDDGNIIDWQWMANENIIKTGSEDIDFSGLSAGTYTISFRVMDDDMEWSAYDTSSLTILPSSGNGQENQKPVANIVTISPSTAIYGDNVYFQGYGMDSDGIIIEYYWASDIDGYLSRDPSFQISDLSVGKHNVIFKVMDNDFDWSDIMIKEINIKFNDDLPNNKPISDPNGPYSGDVNQAISFDGSGSYDTDPGDTIIKYEWDLGDGTNSTGISVLHNYSSIGNYTVSLTLTDNRGGVSINYTYVNIDKSQSKKNSSEKKDDSIVIPGFELILFIFSLLIIIYLKKRKKNNSDYE